MSQTGDLPPAPGTMEVQAASSQPLAEPQERFTPPWVVWSLIFAAFLVFLLMVGVLYASWLRSVDPTSLLEVRGDERHAGIVIDVVPAGGTESRSQTLGKANGFSVRFFMPAGNYRVTLSENGQTLLTDTIAMYEANARRVDLTVANDRLPRANRPAP